MTEANLRAILSHLASAPDAELERFKPARVLAGDTPNGPVIRGKIDGDYYLYIAGIGYVLTTTKEISDIIFLSNVGQVRWVHQLSLEGKSKYEPNKITVTSTKTENTWFTMKFKSDGEYKYLAKTKDARDGCKTVNILYYSPRNVLIREVDRDLVGAIVSEKTYTNGNLATKSKTIGNVTIAKSNGKIITSTRLHERVKVIVDTNVICELKTSLGVVKYIFGSDTVTLNDSPIEGRMESSGPTFTFYYMNECEQYKYQNGQLVREL